MAMMDVMESLNRIKQAKSLVEAYDIQRAAFETLSEKEGDKLYDMLINDESFVSPKTLYMGLNTTKGDPDWEDLKSQVREIVERDGICKASWSCTGRTRHQIQAEALAADMSEYEFDIGYNYKCEIRKK